MQPNNIDLLPNEKFKPIKNFERYLISSWGRVYFVYHHKLIKQSKAWGKNTVLLNKTRHFVDELVAEHYLARGSGTLYHIDLDVSNDFADNLTYESSILVSGLKKDKDEVFIEIRDHSNIYVSNFGRVFKANDHKFLKLLKSRGKFRFDLRDAGDSYVPVSVSAHVLVGEHFLKPQDDKVAIIAKDGNYGNINVANLQWDNFGRKNVKNLVGRRFNRLTVLRRNEDRNKNFCPGSFWYCLCDCGKEVLVRGDALKKGDAQSCGCLRDQLIETSKIYKDYEEIGGWYWKSLKYSADTRKINFDISMEYVWELFLKQERKCALSGLSIEFKTPRREAELQTASLDRIDSSKGYIKGNVQWIFKDLQFMKRHFSDQRFVGLCVAVAKHHENILRND